MSAKIKASELLLSALRMRLVRRLALFAVITSVLVGVGIFAGKIFPKTFPKWRAVETSQALGTNLPSRDTTDDALWRKRCPWLFRDSLFSPYGEALVLPWLRKNALGPGNLVKRGSTLEITLPRGRPLHEYAFDLEVWGANTGFQILDGQELDPPGERVEYHIQKDSHPAFTLRLTLGKSVLAGAARMALVFSGLDTVGVNTLSRLLAFPVPLTLIIPANEAMAARAPWNALPPGKEILMALPMEPSAYPFIKPGPDAIFIHHSRAEVERLLSRKSLCLPAAKGFATQFGDRAIENRPLMRIILGYTVTHALLFLDLTASPRSLTNSVAQETGAAVFAGRVQELGSEAELESELARRCGLAQRTGEGLWVIRYAPGIATVYERLLRKYQGRFEEMGLNWVTVGALRSSRSVNPKGFAGPRGK